ncbi:MAG: hypothetical protein IPJ88_17010 [Myxococcales bacterium]|nr:MAG: hypothetical protein IPJ88_17010 [Myxococcales bacterium]
MLFFEKRWAQAILEAFAPKRDGLWGAGIQRCDFLNAFATISQSSTPKARLGLRVALWMVALAPLWTGTRFCTMAKLPLQARTELLEGLISSKHFVVRELTTLLKLVSTMAMFSVSELRLASGYEKERTLYDSAEEISGTRPSRRNLPVVHDAPDAEHEQEVA